MSYQPPNQGGQYPHGQQPQYGQQGYGAPPTGAPPQQQSWGAPPQTPGYQPQYGAAPPQPPYDGYHPSYQQGAPAPPPTGQYGVGPPAPPGQWGAPPVQGQWGAPPPQGQWGAPPPPQQQQWGAPPPGQYGGGGYGAAPPAAMPPSGQFGGYPAPPPTPRTYLGAPIHPSQNPLLPQHEQLAASTSVDGYDPAKDVEAIKKATKGFGTDEAALNRVILPLSAVRAPVLAQGYLSRQGTPLVTLLEKELRGNYELIMVALVRGPIMGDVYWIDKACAGAGTNEVLLTEMVIGRTPAALSLLKAAFAKTHHNQSLEGRVQSELSFKTKAAFTIAMLGDWKDLPDAGKSIPENGGASGVGGFGMMGGPPQGGHAGPVNQALVDQDVATIKKALGGVGEDETLLSSIIFARSPSHLHAVQAEYLKKTRTPLTRHVKALITGHLQDALLFALEGGKKDVSGAWRDAKLIHKTMDGVGTRDQLLLMRIVRAHWDPPRFKAIQAAYQAKYGSSMSSRIMKETSGDFRDALLGLL